MTSETTGEVSVRGDRVRQARLLRRITSSEVAIHMEWSAPTQTRLEKSESKPVRIVHAEKLAEKLRVPLAFLLAEPGPSLRAEDLLFRAPKTTTESEKGYLVEFARLVTEFFLWLDESTKLPPVKIPNRRTGESIDEIAQRLRTAIGVAGDEPINNLTHSAEKIGVIVVARSPLVGDPDAWDRVGDTSIERPESGEKHFGSSAWVGSYRERPLMLLRAIESWERTRWTVAHELGHLCMHYQGVPASAEEEASAFASELLAPAKAVGRELGPHVTLADLVPIKMKWGISIGALIKHLGRAELIGPSRVQALSKQLYTRRNPTTGRTWGLDEPGFDSRQPERPKVLEIWAKRCKGSTNPLAIAHQQRILPADVIASVFGVRSEFQAPGSLAGPPDTRSESDNVVEVDFQRIDRARTAE